VYLSGNSLAGEEFRLPDPMTDPYRPACAIEKLSVLIKPEPQSAYTER
jgi:hypothetical protein